MEDYEILEIDLDDVDRIVTYNPSEEEEEPPRKVILSSGSPPRKHEGKTAKAKADITRRPAASTSAVFGALSHLTKVKRYRLRVNTIYPKGLSVEDRRTLGIPPGAGLIDFVPSDSENENEDEDGGVFINPGEGLETFGNEGPARKPPPFLSKSSVPSNVKAFVDIAWNDELGLDHAINHLSLKNPTNMPEISQAEACQKISREGPYFFGLRRETFKNVHQFKSGETIPESILREFLITVRAWRVLCFDTESDGSLLYKSQTLPDIGKPGRVPVVFGNPAGHVLIFHDARETPQELVKICEDFSYAKIQSGIENDIHLLKDNGFPYFRNCVDIQALLSLADPTNPRCGIEAATSFVWSPIDGEKLRIKWSPAFNRNYANEKMEKTCLCHSVQDVLVPFAILLKIALEITQSREVTDPYENIFPALNEALELCMSKSAVDLKNPNAGGLKSTLSENLLNDNHLTGRDVFKLNSHRYVQRIRRARGDLVEKFDTGLTWAQIIERARTHFALLNSRLPNANEASYLDLRFHLMDHCSFCGSQEHGPDKCKVLAVPCMYEHGPDIDLPPHAIVCCPALHALCAKCKTRGHLVEVHGRGWKSAGELRRLFLESAPFGLYTSLPYLHRDRNLSELVLPYHFKFGLSGKSLPYAYGDYWLYGGTKDPTPEVLEASRIYRETTTRNLTSTPETYESLRFEKIRLIELAKAKADGTAPVKAKKLSGAQRRRQKQVALPPQVKPINEQNRRAEERREKGRLEWERREAEKRKKDERRQDEERRREDRRRLEERRRRFKN